MMSAHLEYCSGCRQRINELETSNTQVLESIPAEPLTNDLTAMLNQILSQPVESLNLEVEPDISSSVLKVLLDHYRRDPKRQ